MELYDKAVSVE